MSVARVAIVRPEGVPAAAGSVERSDGERPAVPRCAISESFEQYGSYIWRLLLRLGVPERDVDDACQDVFLIAHRRRADFNGRSTFRTWLYGIAVRVASNYGRRGRRRRELLTEAPPEPASDGDPQRALAGQRALEQLDRALSSLAKEPREVFVLYELEELSMAEVASVVGCPLKTAFSRLYAARRHVQRHFRRQRLREHGT